MTRPTIAILLAISAVLVLSQASLRAEHDTVVSYPDGYRHWVHVKSALMSPGHSGYEHSGGFHHIYANPTAVTGYQSDRFPEGSILVFDWLEMRDNAGVFEEGPRRRLDVMVKDTRRFGQTGGWRFERFSGDSHTERAAVPPRSECVACHERLKKNDLVLSKYRP